MSMLVAALDDEAPAERSMPAPAQSYDLEEANDSFAGEMSRATPMAASPMPAGKAESAREEGGFLDKVKRVFGFGSKDEADEGAAKGRAAPPPPPPMGAPAPAPAAAPPPPRRVSAPEKKLDLKPQLGRVRRSLRGRVVVHSAVALVVEVLVTEHVLEWAPAATAQIELSDGTVIIAEVDLTKTTRPGAIAIAASARLALTLPRGTALVAPIRITIDFRGATIVIDL